LSGRIFRSALAALLAVLLAAAGVEAQGGERLSLRVAGAAEGWRPLVRADGLLEDRALREALESGLPVRIHLRVELWEKRLFDRLVEVQEIALASVQDPLDRQYALELRRSERRFPTLAALQDGVQAALRPEIRPTGTGRFYYLATLQVETLSASDLEELRRWLRGDLAPAIAGERAPERAVGTGVQRILTRVLGLPARTYEARSATFTLR
jgi:hypothetical protein